MADLPFGGTSKERIMPDLQRDGNLGRNRSNGAGAVRSRPNDERHAMARIRDRRLGRGRELTRAAVLAEVSCPGPRRRCLPVPWSGSGDDDFEDVVEADSAVGL